MSVAVIRFAITSFKLIKPRNVLIDRIHSNTFVGEGGGVFLGVITRCILCLQVDGPINIWGRGGGGLIISDSIRHFGRGGICRQFEEIAVKRHKTS